MWVYSLPVLFATPHHRRPRPATRVSAVPQRDRSGTQTSKTLPPLVRLIRPTSPRPRTDSANRASIPGGALPSRVRAATRSSTLVAISDGMSEHPQASISSTSSYHAVMTIDRAYWSASLASAQPLTRLQPLCCHCSHDSGCHIAPGWSPPGGASKFQDGNSVGSVLTASMYRACGCTGTPGGPGAAPDDAAIRALATASSLPADPIRCLNAARCPAAVWEVHSPPPSAVGLAMLSADGEIPLCLCLTASGMAVGRPACCADAEPGRSGDPTRRPSGAVPSVNCPCPHVPCHPEGDGQCSDWHGSFMQTEPALCVDRAHATPSQHVGTSSASPRSPPCGTHVSRSTRDCPDITADAASTARPQTKSRSRPNAHSVTS